MKNIRKAAAVGVLIAVTIVMTVTSFAGSGITKKDAEKIALRDAGVKRSQVKRFESEREHGKFEIEFVKKSDGTEFGYEITKKGKVSEKSVEYVYEKNHSTDKIGKKAARKKAAKHSGVSYNKVKKGTCRYEYDNEDKEGKYEVTFKSGGYRYEYDILAPTGTVMEYDKKLNGQQ